LFFGLKFLLSNVENVQTFSEHYDGYTKTINVCDTRGLSMKKSSAALINS